MTAIAGAVGACSSSDRERLTNALLDEQRRYGSDARNVTSLDQASFGISPWRSVPAASPVVDAHLLLVADIRLDNRNEMLQRIAPSSNRCSDLELLLAAWHKAGQECLSWIAGDFAIAVFDARTRVLTLARDPTGQSPLHFARHGDQFAFASMPTALRPILGTLQINRLALARTTCLLAEGDPHSHFEGVDRVLPAEIVRLRAGHVERSIYWQPRTVVTQRGTTADLVEEYRHLLDVAVLDRLRGCSRPVATHLSSGYDSSSVTATAARILPPQDIVAFTSAPTIEAHIPPSEWRIGDESPIAASTAAMLGIRHRIVRDMPPIRDVVHRLSFLLQEPIVVVPNMGWHLQIRREAAELGATCLLSAEFGNFSLNSGGLYVFAEWLRRGRLITWARQARLAAARPDTHWRGVLFNSLRPWLPTAAANALLGYFKGADAADRASFVRPEWRAQAVSSQARPPYCADTYAERAYWIRTSNPAPLRKAALAGEGVDERDPLSDRRLLDFSLRIPPEQLYWNGVHRPLARAALADRLPQPVIDLPVRGLQSADWAARFTRPQAGAMLEEISVSATFREIYDVERMKQAIDRWPTDNWNDVKTMHAYRMCLLLALSGGMFALVHEQAGTSVV